MQFADKALDGLGVFRLHRDIDLVDISFREGLVFIHRRFRAVGRRRLRFRIRAHARPRLARSCPALFSRQVMKT